MLWFSFLRLDSRLMVLIPLFPRKLSVGNFIYGKIRDGHQFQKLYHTSWYDDYLFSRLYWDRVANARTESKINLSEMHFRPPTAGTACT